MPRSPETRRRFLGRAALAAAGATLAARRGFSAPAAPAMAPADAWPQFRGTPTLSGLSAATLPPQLSVAWQWEAGDAIESSAAIAAGTVYVGTRAGELVALELASGKPVWRYKVTGDGVGESSPCVAGGAVFVGDLAGQIHAVDAQSGKALWTHKTAQEVKSSPVAVGELVLVGSYDQSLYALDAKTGKVAWKHETDGPVHATASVAAGTCYVSGCDEILRAIRVADGNELFQVSSGGYTGASAALSGGRAFYGNFENQVLAVDLTAHKQAWQLRAPRAQVPVLLLGRAPRRPRGPGRARQGRPLPRRRDRRVAVELHDAGARRLVTRGGRRAACTWARPTGGSTCSSSRPARSCNSTRSARRSRLRRPSPRHGW